MSKPKTIAEVVAELSAITDQNQPIAYAYWLAENFEYYDKGTPTQEEFAKAITDLETTEWDLEPTAIINDFVYDEVSAREETE
jgi:hypothetical protein